MNVAGSSPIAFIQRPTDTSLALQMNQRIAAEVLQISGDRVLLALEGSRVVARLTSHDQAGKLSERKQAQFIVRGYSDQTLNLQLVSASGVEDGAAAAQEISDLVPSLLRNLGLPTDEATVNIARALLKNRLPVNAALIKELQTALDGLGAWSGGDAQKAASLRAAGLPLSPGILTLAQAAFPDLAKALDRLRRKLESLPKTLQNPRLMGELSSTLGLFDGLTVQGSETAYEMVAEFRTFLQTIGRTIEGDLAKILRDGLDVYQSERGGPGFLELALLRQRLAKNGEHTFAKDVDQFLDNIRHLQLTHAEPEFETEKGQWLRLEIPLNLGLGDSPVASLHTAYLRVAYRRDREKNQRYIDPEHTRLVLDIKLAPGEMVTVDLSLVGKQVGALVTTSTSELKALAEALLPELKAGLARSGFSLQTSKVQTGPLEGDLESMDAGGQLGTGELNLKA
jgi:hypothetical protein